MEEKIIILLERIAVAMERMAAANESCSVIDPSIVELAQVQTKHLKSHLGEGEEPKREDG